MNISYSAEKQLSYLYSLECFIFCIISGRFLQDRLLTFPESWGRSASSMKRFLFTELKLINCLIKHLDNKFSKRIRWYIVLLKVAEIPQISPSKLSAFRIIMKYQQYSISAIIQRYNFDDTMSKILYKSVPSVSSFLIILQIYFHKSAWRKYYIISVYEYIYRPSEVSIQESLKFKLQVSMGTLHPGRGGGAFFIPFFAFILKTEKKL